MYSKKLMDHFLNPSNAGEIADATLRGEAHNAENGNVFKLWLKLNNGIIEKAAFKTVGCAPMIASGSALTTLLSGMSPEDAVKLSLSDLLTELGGVPVDKIHAPRLAINALNKAINIFNNSKKYIKL